MSTVVLAWSVLVAQIVPGPRDGVRRFPHSPRAEGAGPVLGLDTLYVNSMLLLLTFGIAVRQLPIFRGGPGHRALGLRRDRRASQVPAARRGDRMNGVPELPAWAALLTATLLFLGAAAP